MKFQVFDNGKVVEKFKLSGAYLFGTDGIAVRRAQITFRKGFIECKKPTEETAGLALMWPVEGFGKVLLPTTCLPDGKQPYNLNVEIARAKLMQIINKREDWSFFDEITGMASISEQAQNLFIKAVQNISDTSAASKLADESLKRATVFSEKLATKQAELLFNARRKNHSFSRACFGCKIHPKQIFHSKYLTHLLDVFGFVTIPINWAQIEAQKGHFNFSDMDRCAEILDKKKLAIGAGPLLCFSKEHLPKWLLQSRMGFEKIREAAYKFITEVVSRYSDKIHVWRVVSGLNLFNCFGFNFEQVLEMTRAANMSVKASSDRALKIIEISNLWGEYYATVPNTIPPLVYIDMVMQSGIHFEAFGLQLRFGKNLPGMHVKDMMQISSILDQFGPIAKPLYITEVEIPGQTTDANEAETAGIWYEQWNQSRQSKWIEQFYKIALSKPFVNTITYSNLSDIKGSVITNSGLLTDKFETKESFQTLKNLKESIFKK